MPVLCVVQGVALKGEAPVVIEDKARIGRIWSRYIKLEFMQRKNTIIDTVVHNLNWLTESVEFTKDIKRSQCKPPIDSFWSLGLMNHHDNSFHTLQSRAFWLCF